MSTTDQTENLKTAVIIGATVIVATIIGAVLGSMFADPGPRVCGSYAVQTMVTMGKDQTLGCYVNGDCSLKCVALQDIVPRLCAAAGQNQEKL